MLHRTKHLMKVAKLENSITKHNMCYLGKLYIIDLRFKIHPNTL